MSVDTEDRPTNVKRVALPEALKVSDLPFDPKKDISPSLREQMVLEARKKITEMKKPESHLGLSDMYFLQMVAIVLPDELPQLVDDELWEELVDTYENVDRLQDKAVAASTMKFILPPDTENPGCLTEEDWKHAIGDFNVTREDSSLASLSFAYWYNLKVIDPTRTKEFSVPENLWRHRANFMTNWLNSPDMIQAVNFLAKVKVVDPDKQDRLGLNKDLWIRMKDKLGTTDNIINAIDLAASMSILAAREIKITDRGVELVFEEPEKPGTQPQVPATKKY